MANEQAGPSAARQPRKADEPAKIALLYESKDGRLCLFQDAEGHITAVRAANLA